MAKARQAVTESKQPSLTAITILAGESLSDSVDASQGTASYVLMPDAWDGANLTFQISFDNLTFWDLFDQYGNEVTFACRAGTAVRVQPGLQSIGYFKVRSGTRDEPIVQSEDRNFTVAFTP